MTAEHVIQIVHRRVFNCYLVAEEDGVTLVDTCPGGAAPKVLAAIRTLRVPLRRVVLTHAHRDHVGGLDILASGSGGEPEVIIGSREASLLAGDYALRDGEPEPGPQPRSYGHPATRPTRLVDDGDRVGSLRVIATPGHTPGHISLIDVRDGTLLAGDAVSTIGRTAVSGDLVWRWPFPAISTWSKELARDSARRLLDERPSRIASGHGPIVGDAPAGLEAALSRAD
jgi:glyoxylase-like metal-dependent hydrolase (beta-lactamase superfamily II)